MSMAFILPNIIKETSKGFDSYRIMDELFQQ